MKILKENPKKSKWFVARQGDYLYAEQVATNPGTVGRVGLGRNPVFSARLRWIGMDHGYKTRSYASFRDVDDTIDYTCSCDGIDKLMKAAMAKKIHFDGEHFVGLFTFENLGGSLMLVPYVPKEGEII